MEQLSLFSFFILVSFLMENNPTELEQNKNKKDSRDTTKASGREVNHVASLHGKRIKHLVG